MSDDAREWLQYAKENLDVARLCLESGIFNPAIHNAQQSVEKCLKALRVSIGLPFKKSHSISAMNAELRSHKLVLDLQDDECELLDSVYLPSKYPLSSVLPDYEPDEKITRQCVAIAESLLQQSIKLLEKG